MTPIPIIASGSYESAVTGEPPPLKELAREATGVSERRIGRFVQLALIGAGRCVGGRTLPADTATYFASGRADLTATLEGLKQLCVEGGAPSPFTFINTVGNSACFHIAKTFGLSGRSQCVTSRHAPLHAALRLAAFDIETSGIAAALVGSADVCTAPLSDHRERIGVPPGVTVGEGSHWFLLAAGDGLGSPRGLLRDVRAFPDDAALRDYFAAHRSGFSRAALAVGPHLGAETAAWLREATGIERVFDYRSDLPWYDSQTGYGIHRFLVDPPAEVLVHVDGDPSGRRTLLVIETTPPAASDEKPPPRGRRIA
jgi:hypothetical protein